MFLQATEYTHSSYKWNENPTLHELDKHENELSSIVIKECKILEYIYKTDNILYLYKTVHKIVKVNTDQAIEMFNKVFVPMNARTEFVVLQARAISPDGKITNINKENIKEVENVNSWGNFKIFAIEGIEKGGEIEYFYTTKAPVSDPYGREYMQSDAPVKESVISIISPNNLIFEAKSYNDFPDLELTKGDSTRTLTATAENIGFLPEESYSTYRANLMKVDYKLSYNNEMLLGKKLYDWELAAETFKGLIYDYSEEEAKLVKKVLKKLKLKRLNTDEKVKKIETYLKNNISPEEGSGKEFTSVGRILANKYANEIGMSRILAAFLTEAKIEHQLVVTSDRNSSRFDQDFASWANFTDIIFFVKESEKYVSPLVFYRYGAAPYNLANNYGVFIAQNGKTDIKFIPMPTAEYSMNEIEANVNFGENFDVNVDMRHAWTGYRANDFRFLLQYRDKTFLKNRVTSGIEDASVEEIEVHNNNFEFAPENKALYVESKIKTPSLIEKAGKNYLFKVGHLIGGQMELYQEHERQNPIDMDYPTYYERKISFDIPKGYKLQGLEDAKINKVIEKNGEKVNAFVSDFIIEKDKVIITAKEYYRNISLPKEDYENFRQVINAAADFNKVVLVFEKE